MGTPDFAVPSLMALLKDGHNVVAVVTQPDRPKGRGRKIAYSPVKRVAVDSGIEVLQPEKASDRLFCEMIRSRDPDILIVVAFGQILKRELLEIPRWGAINIHASLLPRYRGAAPIQAAILNNEDKTGLTAMKIDEGMDTGPILFQEEISILPDETAGQLHDRLARLSGDFLLRALKDLAENALEERVQEEKEATYASKIDRKMAMVKWDQTAQAVSVLLRALDPWPGAFTTQSGREIKVFSPKVVSANNVSTIPGRVAGFWEGALHVETGDGVVQIKELQAAGKKRLQAGDFLRGFPLDPGTVLGTS